MRHYFKNDWIKFVAGWAIVFAVRLIPFRVPNIEPLTAVQMPFAKRFGWAGGFLFGFLSIVFFDAVTSGIGVWTWVTAFAFGALGTGAGFFFGRRPPTRKNFLVYAVLGTIFQSVRSSGDSRSQRRFPDKSRSRSITSRETPHSPFF